MNHKPPIPNGRPLIVCTRCETPLLTLQRSAKRIAFSLRDQKWGEFHARITQPGSETGEPQVETVPNGIILDGHCYCGRRVRIVFGSTLPIKNAHGDFLAEPASYQRPPCRIVFLTPGLRYLPEKQFYWLDGQQAVLDFVNSLPDEQRMEFMKRTNGQRCSGLNVEWKKVNEFCNETRFIPLDVMIDYLNRDKE